MQFMYVLVAGGAWIFNIPGGATDSDGNTFLQLSLGWGLGGGTVVGEEGVQKRTHHTALGGPCAHRPCA